jgi:hypothetical protein
MGRGVRVGGQKRDHDNAPVTAIAGRVAPRGEARHTLTRPPEFGVKRDPFCTLEQRNPLD